MTHFKDYLDWFNKGGKASTASNKAGKASAGVRKPTPKRTPSRASRKK
jgi:hypothetical protein